MEIKSNKWWKPVHTKWLLIIAITASAYGGLRKYYMDELTLDGYRITNVNNSTLTNADTTIPTSQSVYNAILAASFDPAAGLSGWIDITNPAYGGVANGGFNTGTDNSPAMNAALADAVNNSVIYVPPGSYRFLSTITWPTNRRVFLVCYGNLFFGTQTGFLIQGEGQFQMLWFNGNIYGTDQFGTPNYTGLTNAGIELRNSRNNTVWTNFIHGFKDAIRVSGINGGNQYNKIGFMWCNRNSVGIKITASGTGPWSNENTYTGGEISCDTGIVFAPTTAVYDGNKFYNIGLEYSGNMVPMRVGIKADNCFQNHFYGGRIEPAGVTTKFDMNFGTVAGMSFHGWFMQDAWMTNMGQGMYMNGVIHSNSGAVIGNEAFSYPYSSSNTYQNGRVKITGLWRSPTAAGELGSNIDVEWDINTDAITTASTYTVPPGITFVEVNYSGGTNTTTLPDATTRANQTVTIKNMHASNTVTVVGALAGSLTSIPGYSSISYYSDGSQWVDWATRIVYSGGGGTSQWTTVGNNIYYTLGTAGIGINQTATSYAWLHLGASTSTRALMEFPTTSVFVSGTPRDGSMDFNGTNLRFTAQGVPQTVITDYNTATLVNKSWQGLPIGVAYWSILGGKQGQVAVVDIGTGEMVFRYSFGGSVTITAASYTVHDTVDFVICNRSSGALAITLPAAASYYGREIAFRQINTGSTVTFSPNDPSMSTTLPASQSGAVFKSNGTNWYVKAKY
jgi:hypothetical protein